MEQTEEVTLLIFLAMRQGRLTGQQAMQSYLAFGESLTKGIPFSLQAYWQQHAWLSEFELQELKQETEGLAKSFTPEQLPGDNSLLQTIQQTIHSQHIEVGPPPALQKTAAPSWNTTHAPEWSSDDHEGYSLSALLQDLPDDDSIGPITSSTPLHTFELANNDFQRYQAKEELGRGGLGLVIKSFDRNLERDVACKTLLKGKKASQHEVELFMREAKVTGQLEHPNIIPVHDIGLSQEDELFYTMRVLPAQNTLKQAIVEKKHTLVQFVKILQQVCMGLEYAHSRGVIHRDIKPSNILLGQFGEVLILDWGTAKIQRERHDLSFHASQRPESQGLKGTPPYMAPEQLSAGEITPAVDQYALGVVLYEVLTSYLPFSSHNLYALIFQVCSRAPTPPRDLTPEKHIPEELESICLTMLAKKKEDRFASCREVHDQLEAFLEGTREKERRRKAAQIRIQEAKALQQVHEDTLEAAERLRKLYEENRKNVKPWASPPDKEALWKSEDLWHEAQQKSVSQFGGIVKSYIQALDHEPGNPIARKGLADLYWNRFLESERQHDTLQQIYYRDLVQFYDDGTYKQLLSGYVRLELTSHPKHAKATVYRYEEQRRMMQPVLYQERIESPLDLEIPAGSYTVVLSKEGYRDVHYPVHLKRGESHKAHVKLYTEEDIGQDFVYIPNGSFWYGGDEEAPMSQPLEQVELDDYFISKYPITFSEYLEFLNDIHQKDAEKARGMIPRSSGGEEYACLQDGKYIPARSALFHGPVAERYPEGEGHEGRLPVLGVTWFEAYQYCLWRSQKEERTITLPTEPQWEKAASGADRRIFPWGNYFEPTFCKMGRSRPPQELQPEPVGTFTKDSSPYGVCDMVGTICEWVLPAQGLPKEELTEELPFTPFQRGGGWIASNEALMRIGARGSRPEGVRTYASGFRIIATPYHTPSQQE